MGVLCLACAGCGLLVPGCAPPGSQPLPSELSDAAGADPGNAPLEDLDGAVNPEWAETGAEEPEWDVVIDEKTGQVRAADAEPEVRGARLGAPREDLYIEDPQTGELIRNLPVEAFHSVMETESALGMSQDTLLFEQTEDGRHFKVTFGQLGCYMYEMPDPTVLRDAEDPHALLKDQIPPEIKALDGEPVLLLGFMVPVEFDSRGKLAAFAITQNQAFCCYGVTPAMNDWVMVRVPEGQGVEYRQQEPVAVYGVLEVGELLDEGYVLSLYRLTATEVISVPQLLRRVAT